MTFTRVNTTKKIDSLSAKNKKKLDYKQLKISGAYKYPSDEEQGEQKEQEEQEKQDKKKLNTDEYINWMIDQEDKQVNQEIFQKYFKIQKPSLMYKVLRTMDDKEKNSNLVNMFSSALGDLQKDAKKMFKEEK